MQLREVEVYWHLLRQSDDDDAKYFQRAPLISPPTQDYTRGPGSRRNPEKAQRHNYWEMRAVGRTAERQKALKEAQSTEHPIKVPFGAAHPHPTQKTAFCLPHLQEAARPKR